MALHRDIYLTVAEAESITVRAVTGDPTCEQADLVIKSWHGLFTIRLITRKGRALRLLDMRAKDRKKAKKRGLAIIDFAELVRGKEG